jgi:dTMP kinase
MSKFIVIEGLDGSGKSTQIQLLRDYFTTNKLDFEYIHFPRMDERSPIFGELIARFLRGEFGNVADVDPYLVALLYAGDREHAAKSIEKWLNQDKIVLLDRYVMSNIAFQCAKIENHSEAIKLENWILDLEYNYYKIPKPTHSIFLHVPFEFVQNQLKNQRDGEDRDYLKGAEDIHEKDISFQQKVENKYIDMAKRNKMEIMECQNEKNEMKTEQEIHQQILISLKENNII